jgi:general secretion pathway protein H
MRRTSATGIRDLGPRAFTRLAGRPGRRPFLSRAVGFTLIEILLVVAITGIIVALASVNLLPSDREIARREAGKLALAIEHARDAAWFGGRPTAVSFADGRARLWRYGNGTWQPDAGRDANLGPEVRITTVSSGEHTIPAGERLIFLPDGLDEPFRVALDVRGLAWAIEGDAAGGIAAVER